MGRTIGPPHRPGTHQPAENNAAQRAPPEIAKNDEIAQNDWREMLKGR